MDVVVRLPPSALWLPVLIARPVFVLGAVHSPPLVDRAGFGLPSLSTHTCVRLSRAFSNVGVVVVWNGSTRTAAVAAAAKSSEAPWVVASSPDSNVSSVAFGETEREREKKKQTKKLYRNTVHALDNNLQKPYTFTFLSTLLNQINIFKVSNKKFL